MRSNRKATAGTILLVIFILVALFPDVIARRRPEPQDAYKPHLGLSLAHLLGTTAYGQDMFAQLVWGTQNVLIIAFTVGLGATAIAVLVGIAAAYLGGLWDAVLSVLTDVLLVIPLFPLLIVIAGYARGGSTLVLIVVITATSWSYTARQLRSQALTMRGRDFLEAARARGERKLYIIVVEVNPHDDLARIVASFLTNALYAVLFASSLQFIGLGDPNTVSWGTMLYWAQNNAALQTGQPCGRWRRAPASPPSAPPSPCSATPSTGARSLCAGSLPGRSGDGLLAEEASSRGRRPLRRLRARLRRSPGGRRRVLHGRPGRVPRHRR